MRVRSHPCYILSGLKKWNNHQPNGSDELENATLEQVPFPCEQGCALHMKTLKHIGLFFNTLQSCLSTSLQVFARIPITRVLGALLSLGHNACFCIWLFFIVCIEDHFCLVVNRQNYRYENFSNKTYLPGEMVNA